MMPIWPTFALLATAGLARAEAPRFAAAPEVVKLVGAHVSSLQLDPTIPTIIAPTGAHPAADASIRDLFGAQNGEYFFKPGKIVAAVDAGRGVGWFQGELALNIDSIHTGPHGGYTDTRTSAQRLSGAVVGSPGHWHIVAVMYGNVVADKDLTSAPVPASAPIAFTGDPQIGTEVASWFASGFAKHAVDDPDVVASGTGPGEFRSGPAAVRLAGGADKLGLIATEIEVTPVGAAGAAAFVRARVLLPVPKTRSAVPLVLAAVIVPSADGWRWVSLEFGFAAEPFPT